jgi:hypothetical protein|tara:strand:- start:3845 stop:4102 length:258 start_codon:yes stop_codon:yes gene_type:complete
VKLIRAKTSGELKWIFKDSDTVALSDTKLSVTETDYAGDTQSWERADITTDTWELITATAEEYLLATIHDRPYFNSDTYGNNERR